MGRLVIIVSHSRRSLMMIGSWVGTQFHVYLLTVGYIMLTLSCPCFTAPLYDDVIFDNSFISICWLEVQAWCWQLLRGAVITSTATRLSALIKTAKRNVFICCKFYQIWAKINSWSNDINELAPIKLLQNWP